jgi:alkylation response protein AidB-like acyl-CoA dehydrogenase
MANLLVDERDVKFVLYEQLKIQDLCNTEKYSEYSQEMVDMVLEAAWKLAENELWPVNQEGDRTGVVLDKGQVQVPNGFHQVYQLYCEGGWPSLSVEPEHGGQGAPFSVYLAVTEAFVAANLAFMAYPGLTLGAGRVIQEYGTEDQRRTYMDKMYTGEWAGTMCLTEPQSGSDVGALRTKAVRNPDGNYSIVGGKIFITSGDHDLTENIVHLVLARVEGAPPGTKGISIFIVPKKRLENGTLVDNDVTTAAVEKKLGIHGSATCALNFGEKDDCIGYLIGEENMGMKIMFQLMNEARIGVGLQGVALGGAAYMHAVRYAQERIQGPDVTAMRDPEAPKIPIFDHPDVRRMLMWMKCVTEGARALHYYCGHCADLAALATDEEEAARYSGLIDLLIPVCKAWASDMGFRTTEMAVQVHGGYGYCSEYPVEQFLRDIKITSIYEGTNGIQALDLVGRKLMYKQGALFQYYMKETGDLLDRTKDNPRLKAIAERFEEARTKVVEATTYFAQKGMSGDTMIPVLYATPYMELFGDVAIGFMLLWQSEIADRRLEEIYATAGADSPEKRAEVVRTNRDAAFYKGKIGSAEFFGNTILSLAVGKAAAIMRGERSAVDLPWESFNPS